MRGNDVIVSHGDENLEGTEMGLIAAIDGSQRGDITATKWAMRGTEFGYSSPLLDGTRVYQIDNSSRLKGFDIETGTELWSQPLGKLQRAPPVLADGKIYVGTAGGSFFILRPGADRVEVLSEVTLPDSTNSCCGSEGTPEQIVAGAAVSRGRVFFVSSDAVYAIGPNQPQPVSGFAVDEPDQPGQGAPAHLQVSPTEMVLEPGDTVQLRARAVRRHGALPPRRGGRLDTRGSERYGRQRHAYGGIRSNGTGRNDHRHGCRADRAGTRPRRTAAAVEPDV